MVNSRRVVWIAWIVVAAWWTRPAQAAPPSSEPSTTAAETRAAATDPSASIDAWIERGWTRQGLRPAPWVDDSLWCRRLYLDVVGRVPRVEELATYEQWPRAMRRSRLVATLLYAPEYETERIETWTNLWMNLLVGRSGGTGNNALVNRDGLRIYLRQALREDRPYDRMVHDLLTAEGASLPDAPEFNGAVNYLLHQLQDGSTLQATAHLSRVFLGRQVQCTQCHNHPFNDWKQNQFWDLDSFLRQTVALRRFEPGSDDVRFVVLTDQDFRGEGNTPDQAEIYYEQRNGELRSAYPRFLDGQAIDPSGLLRTSQRRKELARLVQQSDMLATAMVNRIWSHFLGFGLTKPVDDLGPHNPSSHPELLESLSQQFRDAGYDQRKLMQWIVLSKPYRLSSAITPQNRDDDPQSQRAAWFSRFYLRNMSAEQLYQSLLTVTEPAPTDDGMPGDESKADSLASRSDVESDVREEARQRWLRQFIEEFGNDEGGEATTFDGTIPQALMMFNGELMQEAVKGAPGTWIAQVIESKDAFPIKIRQLFVGALARRPSAPEINALRRQLDYGQQQEKEALQDLWWALLNSNEFILNH